MDVDAYAGAAAVAVVLDDDVLDGVACEEDADGCPVVDADVDVLVDDIGGAAAVLVIV